TVGDKGTFTPADYLAASTYATRHVADGVVVVDEGVKDLCAGGLGAFLAVGVIDVLELTTFVLQLEVVPVLAANEDAGVAIFQLKVVYALEDLGEGLTTFEIQAVVVAGGGEAQTTVASPDEV